MEFIQKTNTVTTSSRNTYTKNIYKNIPWYYLDTTEIYQGIKQICRNKTEKRG